MLSLKETKNASKERKGKTFTILLEIKPARLIAQKISMKRPSEEVKTAKRPADLSCTGLRIATP